MKATMMIVVETEQIDAVNLLEQVRDLLIDNDTPVKSIVVTHQSDTMVTTAIV